MKQGPVFFCAALLASGLAYAQQNSTEQPVERLPEVTVTPDLNAEAIRPDYMARLPRVERMNERTLAPPRDVESRAWSTTTGWRPGASAFADEATHESRLTVVSIGSGRRVSWFKAERP